MILTGIKKGRDKLGHCAKWRFIMVIILVCYSVKRKGWRRNLNERGSFCKMTRITLGTLKLVNSQVIFSKPSKMTSCLKTKHKFYIFIHILCKDITRH